MKKLAAVLLVLSVLLLGVTVSTTAGLGWLIAGANRIMPGELGVGAMTGSLLGPLHLENVRYQDASMQLRIASADLDWRPLALLTGTIHVEHVRAGGIELKSLGTVEPQAREPVSLKPLPLGVTVDELTLSDISAFGPGSAEPFIVRRISIGARTSETGVQIESLSVAATAFNVQLQGILSLDPAQASRIETRWWAEAPGVPRIQGTGQLLGSLQRLQISQDISGPAIVAVRGTLRDLADEPAWDATVNISGFDPALYRPDLPGNLSFVLRSDGAYSAAGVQTRLLMTDLAGALRGHAVGGEAAMTFRDDALEQSEFQLMLGAARVSASGSVDAAWNVRWAIEVPDLGLLLPAATGSLSGQGGISGPRDLPHISASLDAGNVRTAELIAKTLQTRVEVDLTDQKDSLINVRGDGLEIKGQSIESLTLAVNGRQSGHDIRFALQQDSQQVSTHITAKLDQGRWTGTLTELQLQSPHTQNWTLQEPAGFAVDQAGGELAALCLSHGDARLCAQGNWQSVGTWRAAMDGENLPLALSKPWLRQDIAVDGSAGLQLQMQSGSNGPSGTARIDITPGSITLDAEEESLLLARFGKSHVTAELQDNVLNAALDMSLQDSGGVKGRAQLTQVVSGDRWFHEQTAIDSELQMKFADHGLISVLVPSLSTSKGQADGNITVSGTLGNPVINGGAHLKNAEVSLPQLGIQLTEVNLNVDGKGNTIAVQGSVMSGEGKAALTGQLLVRQGVPLTMDLELSGENVQVANIPEAIVYASPDLKLSVREKRIDISGAVRIPKARIRLLEPKGVARESSDLVVVNQGEVTTRSEKYQVHSRVSLMLADDSSFAGFGLTGNIGGKLDIIEQPGQVTRGQGELQIIDGHYSLYGQKLAIEKGRLIFLGGPIDNPGLDIRVAREIGTVLAGLRITGTAESPRLDLFSDPSMEQSDVLSYLLFGVPTSRASGGQGAALAGAAASLGLTGGDRLVRKLGETFGLEEVHIESGDTVEDSSLILGKYLSPRMYVSYAVGLFNQLNTFRIRYTLSRRWTVQTEAGAAAGADLLYSLER